MVIACRDVVKAEDAAREISSQTGGRVTTLRLDLASLQSVRRAVQELKLITPKIDLLVNNAGTDVPLPHRQLVLFFLFDVSLRADWCSPIIIRILLKSLFNQPVKRLQSSDPFGSDQLIS